MIVNAKKHIFRCLFFYYTLFYIKYLYHNNLTVVWGYSQCL